MGRVALATHLGGGDGVLGGLEIDVRHGDDARYARRGERRCAVCDLATARGRVRRCMRDGGSEEGNKKRFFPWPRFGCLFRKKTI
jgi:hypothetical protein